MVEFPLDCQAFEILQRQEEEQTDSAIEQEKCFTERALDVGGSASYRCGIRYAPMRSDGLAGPQRAHFPGGVVTDGQDKIKLRRAGLREFVPVLSAQTRHR